MTAEFEDIRVLIGVPTYNGWDESFGQCVIQAFEYARERVGAITLRQSVGTLLNDTRTHLVEQAQQMGATHIMFLDNDMTFPPDTIMRLLAHRKPIVGANYVMRKHPFRPVTKSLEFKYLYTDHVSHGLEEAAAGGFGVVLIEMGVFEAVQRPWFDGGEARSAFNPQKEVGFGEDYFFCYKARQTLGEGFGFWVDHDLSKLVGHVGKKIYTFEDALSARAEAELIKEKLLEAPGAILPHEVFEQLADLPSHYTPEQLEEMTREYREHAAAELEAEKRAILAENAARLEEFKAA